MSEVVCANCGKNEASHMTIKYLRCKGKKSSFYPVHRSEQSDEMRVRKALPISAAIQFNVSGLFAIVQVDASTAKDGKADAVVISASFPTEAEAWTDAAKRLPS